MTAPQRPLTSMASKIRRLFACPLFLRVPYCVPTWGWKEHWHLLACSLTGRLIEGPHVSRLLAEMSRITSCPYVYGFNSGRDAIRAALLAWGIGRGDHVIMPSFCCASVAAAVNDCEAIPLFCDIGDDYNPNIDHIIALLSPNVRAILFTHLFGNPGRIDKLEERLRSKDTQGRILLIDDAAQSFGARINDRLIGTFGDVGIISFGPGKTMTATAGGLLLTASRTMAERVSRVALESVPVQVKIRRSLYFLIFRRWRKYTRVLWPLLGPILRRPDYRSTMPVAVSNVDAAIALDQLGKLEEMLTIRRNRKLRLDNLIVSGNGVPVAVSPRAADSELLLSAATKYPIRLALKSPDANLEEKFIVFMERNGIELQRLYQPLHLAVEGKPGGTLSQTECVRGQALQIPIEPSISSKDFEYVLDLYLTFTRLVASTGKDGASRNIDAGAQ